MDEYSYKGFHRIGVLTSKVTGIVAIFISTAVAGFLIFATTKVPLNRPGVGLLKNPNVTMVCLVFYIAFLGWTIGLTFINFLPTIWIREEGLIISAFLVFRILIPWSDIIRIRIRRFLSGNVLVSARKIIPFHRIYGWLYSRTVDPSFLIGIGINDRDTLIREIQ
jgi:hypothetical protein